MNKLIQLSITISLLLLSTVLWAQGTESNNKSTNTFTFKTQFFQIKDEFNYGLVYSGISLVAEYDYAKTTNKGTFTYTPEIGFGGCFNKGAGLAWRFKPIDLFYGYKINEKPMIVGAYFATDYQWQQYSELQGGRLFWFSSLEIGPRIIFNFNIKNAPFKIAFSNSIAGFTSRPEPGNETYYYSFSFSEFISSAHSNLKFGSYNFFNHTQMEIELPMEKKKRFSIGYQFEYFGYYQEPTLSFINHSINLKWKIGKL